MFSCVKQIQRRSKLFTFALSRSKFSHNANIQEEFARQSDAFYDVNKQKAKDLLQPLINHTKNIHSTLASPDQCRILDVACGPGLISMECAKQLFPFNKITGIDITKEMLDIAKNNAFNNKDEYSSNGQLEYLECNVEQLPFSNDEFDIVITRWTFHHFNQLNKVLNEIYRVLKKNCGKLIFMELNPSEETDRIQYVYNAIETLRDPTHVWAFTKTGWIQQLQHCGFDKDKIIVREEYNGKDRNVMDWIKQTNVKEREPLHILCEEMYNTGVDTGFNLSKDLVTDQLIFKHPYIIIEASK